MSDFRGQDVRRDPPGRHTRAMALGVVALAFVLRLPWPSGWWPNPDEGIYYRVITHPTFDAFWADATAHAHPPLYFLILRAVAYLTTDFGWLRAPAFFAGVAAVYAFIAVGREVGGPGRRGIATGLLAGTLLAVSPRAIALSQVVRPYTLLLLLLAGALCFLLRSLRTGRGRDLLGYAACASLALTLHYSAALALGVFGLLLVADGAGRGAGRPEWRRAALVQVAPALTLALLYVSHLRALMGSAMADQALGGWLSAYLVRGPLDVWLGVVGVHASLVGERLAPVATLLTLAGLAWAAGTRRWAVLAVGGGGVALGAAGAVAGLYPLGASRHAVWLLAFLTPVAAWTIVRALEPVLTNVRALEPVLTEVRALEPVLTDAAAADAAQDGRVGFGRLAPALLLALLLAGAGPVGSLLDSERRPREISEQVLQVAHVAAMADVLDPARDPRLVLMSTETYQLLAPLLVDTGAPAVADGGLRRLRWGARDVIVLPGRDFVALPDALGRSNHLYTATQRATAAFDVEAPGPGEPVLVLAGGWRSQGMDDLVALAGASPGLGTGTHVPGLIAVELDYGAYRTALGLPAQ